MRRTTLYPALALGAALFASGCESVTGPRSGRVVGILEWVQNGSRSVSASLHPDHGGESRLQAPDTVQAGVPFTATVTTIGPSSCWRADGATVQPGASLAVITPYDLTAESADVACAQVIVELPRKVEVTFTARGQATLRVVGRRVVGQDFQQGTQVTVEKHIHVR